MNRMRSNLQVSKLVCIPTERAQGDMYQRSFSIGMKPGDSAHIEDFMRQQGVGMNAQLNMPAVAKHLGGIVSLSTTPTGTVEIPHGWSTERLLFMLAIEEYLDATTTYTHYVQGYNEYNDATMSGRLDPRALYYINSITTVIRSVGVDNSVSSRVLHTFNVVTTAQGGYGYELDKGPDNNAGLIRPSDVVAGMHYNAMYGDYGNTVMNVKTSSLNNGSDVSKRSNNDPLRYFTDTTNAIISGKSMAVGSAAPADVLNNANGLIDEIAVNENGFVAALSSLTGVLEPNSFTLDQLEMIDPGVSNKLLLVSSGSLIQDNNMMTTMLDTDVTESLLNFTTECSVAQLFVNSLSAAMSDNLLTVLSGTFTNITSQPLTTVANINSFLEGIDITPYGNNIVNYINAVIAPQVTNNNLWATSIVFECDLLGATTVNVSIDNGPGITYRLPTYADSLYTPVLTDKQTKEALVSDFETITDTVMSLTPEVITGAYNGY